MSIFSHTYDNGLALIGQSMPWLESAAFTMLLPAGCYRDPQELAGLANFTCEMAQRGCGERDSRQFVSDLERLGVDHSSSVSNAHASYSAAMISANLLPALSIQADLLRRPLLPEDQLEEGRLVCLQELRAVEDELAHKVMIALRSQLYPDPWGRSRFGTFESLQTITHADIARHFQATYQPGGTIIGVAGKFDWDQLRDHVGELLGDWPTSAPPEVEEIPVEGTYQHIEHDSNQTHIGVAFDSVPYADPRYYQARGAIGVLSDGMSSRLFTEVREKRGLCYTVHASIQSLRDRGSVLCYAGTSTDRAQETLDVMVGELVRLAEGVEEAEVDRLKAGLKSTVIMQQESSTARSAAIAYDTWHRGSVVTLDEIKAVIDGLTSDSINAYLREHPPRDFTVVTLGEKELEVPVGVSSPDAG